jgi:hypothetical protein
MTRSARQQLPFPLAKEPGGCWKADECYALLQPILKTGLVAFADFNLREVLELIRWSERAERDLSPGGQGPRGHWMRLFACTVLVRLAPEYQASFDSECDTLAQLISSAIDLAAHLECARRSRSMAERARRMGRGRRVPRPE